MCNGQAGKLTAILQDGFPLREDSLGAEAVVDILSFGGEVGSCFIVVGEGLHRCGEAGDISLWNQQTVPTVDNDFGRTGFAVEGDRGEAVRHGFEKSVWEAFVSGWQNGNR